VTSVNALFMPNEQAGRLSIVGFRDRLLNKAASTLQNGQTNRLCLGYPLNMTISQEMNKQPGCCWI